MNTDHPLRHLLGVVSPSSAAVAYPVNTNPSLPALIVPAAIGALGGATLWSEHRFLGFLSGEAIGGNIVRMVRGQGDDRKIGLCSMGTTGAGVVGSLMMPKRPVIGFLAGFTMGIVATSFVPGSNANIFWKRISR